MAGMPTQPEPTTMSHTRCATLLLLLPTLLLGGCASLIGGRMADNLASAIANQDDPATVRDGLPAYLLMMDGLAEGDADDAGTLMAAARLNALYAAVFLDGTAEADRGLAMTDKALRYARRALCASEAAACGMAELPFEAFQQRLQQLDEDDLDALFTAAQAWLLWIQRRSDDWSALADLPKVEAMLERVIALDDAYGDGQAHLYLGILRSLRPPSLGGRPEQGRAHFERAMALSKGRDLAVPVAYARYYARLVYDRALFQRLLEGVLAADPHVPGLTFSNVLAQREARALLRDADDYFLD